MAPFELASIAAPKTWASLSTKACPAVTTRSATTVLL
jgi:hypothetical protein